MHLSTSEIEKLVAAALAVRQLAYAPYSQFKVGAAILSESGSIVSGCNVENASYGLTLCAERNATTSMIAQGMRRMSAIAVACSGAGSPCGACRQVLAEFGEQIEVILVNADDERIVAQWNIRELLPHAFKL